MEVVGVKSSRFRSFDRKMGGVPFSKNSLKPCSPVRDSSSMPVDCGRRHENRQHQSSEKTVYPPKQPDQIESIRSTISAIYISHELIRL